MRSCALDSIIWGTDESSNPTGDCADVDRINSQREVRLRVFDATGRLYQTSKLAEGLADQGWNPDEREGAKVLLIETPSLKDPRYTHEMSMLDAPGTISEDDKVLYVVSCFDQEFVSGYHTSKQVARVLGHSRARFRVRLLDEHGAVLNHSAEPISGKTLRKWLRE